jgi:hypothetical protein
MKTRIAAILMALTCAASVYAQPPSFALTAPDGSVKTSEVLERPGQWVLVYAVPGSAASDRLVQWLGEGWSAQDSERILFVISGKREAAATYLAAKGGEALAKGARWFADPEGDAWKGLKLQGSLAVVGMVDSRIDWKLDGIIADPSVLQDPITRWLR